MKWLEDFSTKIKKNKGLWFTLLSLFSIIGIFVSLYFVSYLVDDVATKTYDRQKMHYIAQLKTDISKNKDYVLALATVASKDKYLVDTFSKDDANISSKLDAIALNLESSVNKTLGQKDIKFKIFQTPANDEASITNGIVVQNSGTYFQSIVPFAQKNDSLLNIEVLESIDILHNTYKDSNKELVFLLNNSSHSKIDSLVLKKIYSKISNEYMIKNNLYTDSIKASIEKLDLKQLKEDGQIKDGNYFFVSQKVFDSNGGEVGLIVVGEKIDDNSLVKLVKSLVNNVTMVALGLIVSMILFLF